MTDPLDVAAPVSPGQVLAEKYRVERVIAAGGMGVVVAATHLGLGQLVALKLLRAPLVQSSETVRRFLAEARAAARIKGEHVAKVLDCGTLPSGVPFIVMEHLDGIDLCQMLAEEGALPVPRAVDLVLEAAEAVAEAHAKGIVHRDLKPGNLMLARRDDGTRLLKVLDFGIAKFLSDGAPEDGAITETADVLGTVRYMSPEQLRATRDVTGRADVWALAVVLYELVTGETPFERGSRAETASAILHEDPRPLREHLPDVSPDLTRVLESCLEKDPGRRCGSIAELAAGLAPFGTSRALASLEQIRRICHATEAETTEVGRAERDPTNQVRRQAWSIAAVVVVVVAGAIALGTAGTASTPTTAEPLRAIPPVIEPAPVTAIAPESDAPIPAEIAPAPAASIAPPSPSARIAAPAPRPKPAASPSSPPVTAEPCPDPKCARK